MKTENKRLKHITAMALFAAAAEAILCWIYAEFGTFSILRSEDSNLIGQAVVFFHYPGLVLNSILGHLWLPLIVFTGVLQWFFLALVVTWFFKIFKKAPPR